MSELTTSIENIELTKDLLADLKNMLEIRNGNIVGAEAVEKIVSLFKKSLENGMNVSFEKIGEYYNAQEKEQINTVVQENCGNVKVTIEKLIGRTPIELGYIANDLIIQVRDNLKKLIGDMYFDLLEKNSKGEPIFLAVGSISQEELNILLPNETFSALEDFAKNKK